MGKPENFSDCISHEPVYLSQMLTLRKTSFLKMWTTCANLEPASSSRRVTSVTSRLVTSLTLDLLELCWTM